MNRETSYIVNKQTKRINVKKGLTSFVFTPQTTLSFVPSLFKKFSCNQKPLAVLLSSLLCGTLALSGCSNSDSSGSSDTLNVDITSNVPANVVAGNQAILDAEVNVNGGQAANAALFTLGADASTALATITAINYPSVSGVDFTQIIPNGTELPDCIVGLSLSNAKPACMLKVSIEGQAGTNVNDDIEVVTDVQTLDIAIQTSFVNTGSTSLPQGQISNQVTIAPDSTVQITVSNSQTNTASFNNLQLTIPSWLADIATNLVGGTVSANGDGSKTITYTVNGANVDLAPGQTHTFSFDLGGDEITTLTLLAYYDELINNSASNIIVVNASNLRNPLTPSLTVSLTPASLTDEVTLSNPATPQTATLQNLSNSQLRITAIDDTDLPTGVTITGGTCANALIIEPKNDEGDSCTIQLTVAATAVPEDNKTLSIGYEDPQNNTFNDSTMVTIGGAQIAINGFNSIALPVSGDRTTNVTITNTGNLNWLPSNMTVNYEITQQGQSIPAANISVTNGSGTNCLAGAAVAPAGTCNIGIQTTAGNVDPDDNTAEGNYVLSVLPANNLETTYPKDFSVTEPTLGSLQFQDENDQDITTQNFEIGDDQTTIKVVNEGAIAITNFVLSIPGKFTQTINTCDDDTTLETGAENACTVTLSVDNGAGTGGENPQAYEITATGDAETVNNSPQTLAATVQGAVVTIPSFSIPVPNIGNTITTVTITNNGTTTIAWNPSNDINDYTITGTDTTGLSVVDPTSDNPYCVDGAEVAQNGQCDIGIQVADTAVEDTYTLTLALTDNLAAVQPKNFEVTGTLGYFSFSPSSITIGTDSTTQPQEITLTNYGETTITNVYLDSDSIPAGFTLPTNTNNCGTRETKLAELASSANCTFEIAASNDFVLENSPVTISVIGDEATVENDEAEFETTISGVVVEIQAINGGQPINRSAAGSEVTNVQITNLSNVNWTPSTDENNGYSITDVQIQEPVTYPTVTDADGETNCLAGAEVTPGASCYIGIATVGSNSTSLGSYKLQVLATGDLPQASNEADFTITESLGYFEYSGDGISNNDLTLTIDADPVTVTLTNIGETPITAVTLNTGNDANKFTVTNSGSCDGQLLAADNGSCTFDLALSGTAVAGADYAFTTTGTNVSNSPIELTVISESGARFIQASGAGEEDCLIDTETNLMIPKSGKLITAPGQSWTNAENDPANQNAANLCGYNDWRQPTMLELAGENPNTGAAGTGIITGWDTESICGAGGDEVCDSPVSWLQAQGFGDFYTDPTTQPWGFYWSGTENVVNPSDAWAVCLTASCFFGGYVPGDIVFFGKSIQLGVLPVRPK